MVSVVDVAGLLVILGVNTLAAALMTRLFRVRLSTRWGAMLYALAVGGVVLVVLTMVLSAAGLGPNLGSASAVLGLTVVVPLALGVTFDYFWMPAPEEVELPDKYRA